MNGHFDLLLPKPLPEGALRGLLFGSFFLHFVFVLFTIGTAVLGLTYYVRRRFGGDESVEGWDRHFLGLFFAHKSIAIVLGVGPILIMQVGNSVPFITAEALLGPQWLGIIVFLIAALFLLEALNERRRPGGWGYLVVGAAGLGLLLTVPATFAAVIATAERPSAWRSAFAHSALPASLSIHWLVRLLHVLGAAVVFTAALHLMLGRHPEKRHALARWIMGGIAVQIPLGVALFLTLPRAPGRPAAAALLLGIAAAVMTVWVLFRAAQRDLPPSGRSIAIMLVTLLTGMLLTRQFLQDAVLVPLDRSVRANAAGYQAAIASNAAASVESYRTISEVPYDNPLTIYARSCHFCHGAVGNGEGHEAVALAVPPEDLTGLRMGDRELERILRTGVPGTAMPPFTFYTGDRLHELMKFLREQITLRVVPEPPERPPSQAARAEARRVFDSTCTTCHGKDGRGNALSRGFRPAPPDLTALSLSARRAMHVLERGYPGTMMPSFSSLPEETRLGLVEIVQSFYRQ